MSLLPSLNSIAVGMTLLYNNEPYQVLIANFSRQQQRKPVMQTKMKSLITGKVLEINFKPGDTLERADLEKRKAEFLYRDPSGVYFMDTVTYDQFSLPLEILGDKALLLKDGTIVDVAIFNENPISVSFPPKIDLLVTSAPPSIKGDSASNVTKQVTLETGLTINVPLFVKEGDRIRLNTESLEYVERV